MSQPFLIYGATGYTGKLIASEAKARGESPILAGRNPTRLAEVARPLGYESRTVTLGDAKGLRQALADVACVLHVAGPFSATAEPMLEACLDTGTHYLDVTGEIDVFERAASLDERAREAGVMLLPGCGFDVVPSDCLAAWVSERIELPQRLRLAISAGGAASRGTTKTALESIGDGTRVRRGGEIVALPAGSLTRKFDFGRGPHECVAMPWGDVATAWYSTAIPDIEVYFEAVGPIRSVVRMGRWLGWMLRNPLAQGLLKAQVAAMPEGPDEDQRERTRSVLIAEVENDRGETARGRLTTPNGYTLTAQGAVEIARRVCAGEVKHGFQTPSTAFGADFVLELPGCEREAIE